MEKIGTVEIAPLKQEAAKLKSGLGVVAWATLEMLRQGGLPEVEITSIQKKMNEHFARPSNDVCNAVLKVVEDRLQEDKEPSSNLWY